MQFNFLVVLYLSILMDYDEYLDPDEYPYGDPNEGLDYEDLGEYPDGDPNAGLDYIGYPDEDMGGYDEDEDHMTAYDNDYGVVEDDETGGDAEFDQFNPYDPDEFEAVGYKQLEHVSYADPEFGTAIGGKFSKLEKIIQLQTVSKEKLYLQKLKALMNQYFPAPGKIEHYAIAIQNIPHFWLKNAAALAATLYVYDSLNGLKLTAAKLADYSKKTGIRIEDLYRYYRLVNEHLEII